MIQEATQRLREGKDLAAQQMFGVMQEIISGTAETPLIVSFLSLLNSKGETVEEVTAAAKVLRKYVTTITTKHKVILDTCGTGADKSGTFNISTVAAFIASGCGIAVAKHGNRSVSSCCGSADILEALGVNINLNPEKLGKCLDEIGIVFLFAQSLHPAMKFAAPARKQMGVKTMFNILGPLTNPACATHQLLGVYDSRWVKILAQVIKNLGTKHALVVRGEDGLDEITTTAATEVSEVNDEGIINYKVNPEDFGFKNSRLQDLKGGSIADNTRIMLDILGGKESPKRDIAVLNAAAAIYVADKVSSIKEGIMLAKESIDSGEALKKLELLKEFSHKD